MNRDFTQDEIEKIQEIEERNKKAREVLEKELYMRQNNKYGKAISHNDEEKSQEESTIEMPKTKDEAEVFFDNYVMPKSKALIPKKTFKEKHPRLSDLPLIKQLLERNEQKKIEKREAFKSEIQKKLETHRNEREKYQATLRSFYTDESYQYPPIEIVTKEMLETDREKDNDEEELQQ